MILKLMVGVFFAVAAPLLWNPLPQLFLGCYYLGFFHYFFFNFPTLILFTQATVLRYSLILMITFSTLEQLLYTSDVAFLVPFRRHRKRFFFLFKGFPCKSNYSHFNVCINRFQIHLVEYGSV